MSETVPQRPVITRALLRELGDWRAEKEGRRLAAVGQVLEWHYEPPLLSGTVRDPDGSQIRARIKLADRASQVENLCSCRQSREQGTICAHVMALVFTTMQPASPIRPPVSPVLPQPVESRFKVMSGEEATETMPMLELKVLLPLDLKLAWLQPQMRILMEASVNGEPFRPLDALSPSETYVAREADLRALSASTHAGMWMLASSRYDDFFDALTGHPNVWLGKRHRIQVRDAVSRPRLSLRLEPTGECRVAVSLPIEPNLGSWYFDGETLTRVTRLPVGLPMGEHRLTRTEFARFHQTELPGWLAHVDVKFSADFDRLEFVERPAIVALHLDGGLDGLTVTVNAPKGADWEPDPSNPFRYWRHERFSDAEIRRAGFEKRARDYRLVSEHRVGHFLANVLPEWERRWRVSYGPQFAHFLKQCDRIEPSVGISSSGQDWLAVDLTYDAAPGATGLSAADVQRMLEKGHAHRRLPNGRVALVPTEVIRQFQDVVFDCNAEQSVGRLKVRRQFAPYLAESLRDTAMRAEWQTPVTLKTVGPVRLPAGLEAVLRPYQLEGVNWLAHLSDNNLAGILADEMGLGKTAQTLAWLTARRHRPALVVCPTSLLSNWESEAARFAPELKSLVLRGSDRSALFAMAVERDLVITSYALLRRDAAWHREIAWQAVVLDEAQQIKNRFSQVSQLVKTLRCAHRVVLTGTPMENALSDLWSIFDFLMPGYLGPAAEFRQRYEKQRDEATLRRLQQRLRPFILRRTKAEVARELPARIDQVAWCELTGEQRAVYESLLTRGRREVFGNPDLSATRRQMTMLMTLLRLRQACCHLGLLPGERETTAPSAKLEMCLELIEQAVSGGHRVLVFSQFVKLLKLVAAALPVPHCYLDGATPDRAGEIRRFQASDIPVFLISLKAGGTGLNLTAADTVIHLDPWWNPAVEDQATARAHRIGQHCVVNAYKLIARGTVEERILKLQETKRELIAQTVQSDDAFVQHLTTAEWEELLR